MTERDDIQRHRTVERRHMIRVKDALARVVARLDAGGSADESGDPAFVSACVDYLEFIVGRFISQGLANVDRLNALIPATDAASLGIVHDIERTLAGTRQQLDRLVVAREAAASGAVDVEVLAAAGRTFLGFYDSTLARRKDPAQAVVEKYIDPDTYWRETNDVTDASIETERTLFHRLTVLAPDIVQSDPD